MRNRFYLRGGAIALAAAFVCGEATASSVFARAKNARDVHGGSAAHVSANRVVVSAPARFGLITGTVRDANGNPLAGAVVSLLREGVEKIVAETRSAADGSFSARVAPGRYVLRAAAEGFNASASDSLQVNPRDQIFYAFKLEAAGQGRTMPERRRDRDDTKYRLRSAHASRSIFQYDGDETKPSSDAEIAANAGDEAADATEAGELADQLKTSAPPRRAHGFIETYTASGAGFASSFVGANFAVAAPVNDQLDLIFAGQLGNAPLRRLELTARTQVGARHRVGVTFGGAQFNPANAFLGSKIAPAPPNSLGQIAIRAIDEWEVRDGIVLVFGLDYSRFTGANQNGSTIAPRFGVQFDADARTRLKAAYASGSSSRVENSAQFEGAAVVFREPDEVPVAFSDGRAVTERSSRLEFSVERVLDDNSSVEATAFFDTTGARPLGLFSLPINALAVSDEAAAQMPQLAQVINQQGAARGVRVVYARRLNSFLKAYAAYAAGTGQELAPQAATLAADANAAIRPDQIFRSAFFQTVAAQLDANLHSGTSVRTVLRFSPRAAVFAIDPLAGRLAVYDPSLSVIVTQELPTFGLPVRAQAVIDARNIFDTQTSVDDGDALAILNAMRRSVRGGIAVRF